MKHGRIQKTTKDLYLPASLRMLPKNHKANVAKCFQTDPNQAREYIHII